MKRTITFVVAAAFFAGVGAAAGLAKDVPNPPSPPPPFPAAPGPGPHSHAFDNGSIQVFITPNGSFVLSIDHKVLTPVIFVWQGQGYSTTAQYCTSNPDWDFYTMQNLPIKFAVSHIFNTGGQYLINFYVNGGQPYPFSSGSFYPPGFVAAKK